MDSSLGIADRSESYLLPVRICFFCPCAKGKANFLTGFGCLAAYATRQSV